MDSRHIVLELTESCFVTDMGGLKEIFKHLRGMRIQIAMDDFGTGYSSLGDAVSVTGRYCQDRPAVYRGNRQR